MLSSHPVSPFRLWKPSEKSVPQLSNRLCFLTQSSPLHHQSLTSTSSSPPGNFRTIKTFKCRSSMSMGVQQEKAATTDESLGPQPELVEIPSIVEITIPPESLVGFESDYERVAATWPADLATTTDYAKIEPFVTSAHALARRWLPQEVISRLERFMYDPNDSPALVIRGFPIDKELPPTELDAHVKKFGKCMSETWLVGISRIVGQVFTFLFVRGSRPGMGLLVRELYPTADSVDKITSEGSRKLLDFHLDFPQVPPEKFPNVIAFIGVRGDRNKEGKTLLCNNRKLYPLLDPADIQVLRTEKLTWSVFPNAFSQYVIQGPENNPRFNVFEENLPGMGGLDRVVQGSPEARAAYKRVKEIAATLAEGVWLGGGDVLLLNQKKANHGRSPFDAKFDGEDRWLQRTYINSGGFWETGLTVWPNRTIPNP